MTQVPFTDEVSRIASMDRRYWVEGELERMAEVATDQLKLPIGTMKLWPAQVRVLAEAYKQRGCYASLPVGSGKTLVSFLLPLVLGSKRPLLMVPASLKEKTFSDFVDLRKHWKGTKNYPVLSLEQIQTPNSRNLLNTLKPDLIVIDEAQNIASHKSARTRRIMEYFNNNPGCMLVALTGTPLRISVMDYWHIVRAALKKWAPLPSSRMEMEKWAEAIDVEVRERRDPGALGAIFNTHTLNGLRTAFKDRMRDTWGFISIVESSCDMPIKIKVDSDIEVPPKIMTAIENVRETGETLDHDLLESGAHVREHIGELANGFHYYWEPPPPEHWRQARKLWHKFVRDELERDNVLHDSPALVAQAYPDNPLLRRWLKVKDEYDPEEHRTVRWISDYILDIVLRDVGTIPTIIWVSQVELGKRLAMRSGWTYFGGGPMASKELVALSKAKNAGMITIILSIHAHHQGKNLQAWSNAYYLTCPSSIRLWEQSLGRMHRPGQENMVNVTVATPVQELRDSFSKALDRSKFIYETTGQLQKLLDAKIHRTRKKVKK